MSRFCFLYHCFGLFLSCTKCHQKQNQENIFYKIKNQQPKGLILCCLVAYIHSAVIFTSLLILEIGKKGFCETKQMKSPSTVFRNKASVWLCKWEADLQHFLYWIKIDPLPCIVNGVLMCSYISLDSINLYYHQLARSTEITKCNGI